MAIEESRGNARSFGRRSKIRKTGSSGDVVVGKSFVDGRVGEILEAGKSARKKGDSEEEEDDEEEFGISRDPLEILGPEILTSIMELLDAGSVARSISVSVGWHGVATCNSIWEPLYQTLLRGKAHIPCVSMVRGASKLSHYSLSVMDGRRNRIVKEDLCDHVWEFRFKKVAPEYWRNLDPSWMGMEPPMHRYFHPDGSQTADHTDAVWGGHECTYCIVTSFVGEEGKIREHYVRINRWPQMLISRKEDWSWEMSNSLYHYNSVPDAKVRGPSGPFFPVW